MITRVEAFPGLAGPACRKMVGRITRDAASAGTRRWVTTSTPCRANRARLSSAGTHRRESYAHGLKLFSNIMNKIFHYLFVYHCVNEP